MKKVIFLSEPPNAADLRDLHKDWIERKKAVTGLPISTKGEDDAARQHLDRFGPAITEFGKLPPLAQRALAEELNIAVFQAVAANEFILPPGKHAERLNVIAGVANKLLRLLDAEDGRLPTWTGPLLLALAKQRVSLPVLTENLHKLAEVAEQAANTERARKQPGRGGSRRKSGPGEGFLQRLFCIYDDTRHRHPKSGHRIGFGGPLCRFIDEVYTSIEVVAPTHSAVKSAFNRWCKTNPPKN